MNTSSSEPASGRHAGREIYPPAPLGLPTGHHEARRAHLLAEVDANPARSREVARRTIRRRAAIGGLLTAGLGVGLATALIVTPTAKLGGNQPVESAEAKTILLRASQTAAKEPELRPRPDQYLYFESEGQQLGESGKKQPVTRRQAWLSADGKHAGLVHNEGEDALWLCDSSPDMQRLEETEIRAESSPLKLDLAHPPTGCTPGTPAYRPNLPDDAEGMRAWLYRNSQGEKLPDLGAFVTVGDTIREAYIGPKSQAAMFAAAAKIPGVTVTKNVVTLAGRQGIAVGLTLAGQRSELIFDAKTYRYLGERTVVDYYDMFRRRGIKPSPIPSPPPSAKRLPEGTVFYTSASLRVAVIDRPGQVPGR